MENQDQVQNQIVELTQAETEQVEGGLFFVLLAANTAHGHLGLQRVPNAQNAPLIRSST